LKPVEINFVPIAVGLSEVVGRAVGLLVPITRHGNVNKRSSNKRRVGIIASQSQRNRSRAPQLLALTSRNGILGRIFSRSHLFCDCLAMQFSDALSLRNGIGFKVNTCQTNYYISLMTERHTSLSQEEKEHTKSPQLSQQINKHFLLKHSQ
jgi:hypothetical protein